MTRHLVLSFFYAGFLRPAPGTWGSLAALPVAWAFWQVGGPILLAVAIIAALAGGTVAIARELEESGAHDPGWIVIDEVVGQWIALLPVAVGATVSGASPTGLWPGVLAAFLLFRLFDIWKPWLVGHADRREDAFGVMLDDLWAGVFAACGVTALAALAHFGLAR